jgi:predicted nucleotidyltransferase
VLRIVNIYIFGGFAMLTMNEIRTIITPLVEIYPVRRVILFGSYARGNETERSDIDLIIDSEGKLDGFEF